MEIYVKKFLDFHLAFFLFINYDLLYTLIYPNSSFKHRN